MKTCYNCKTENVEGARYCSKCGAPLDKKEYLEKIREFQQRKAQRETKAEPQSEQASPQKQPSFFSRTCSTFFGVVFALMCCLIMAWSGTIGVVIEFVKLFTNK
jgi:uncharacterized membrane protein YvbJ